MLVASVASAQKIRDGVVHKGTVYTKTANLLASQSLNLGFVIPAGDFLVITQICASPNAIRVSQVSTGVAFTESGISNCTTYGPGIALAGPDDVRCADTAAAGGGCLVTGILTQ